MIDDYRCCPEENGQPAEYDQHQDIDPEDYSSPQDYIAAILSGNHPAGSHDAVLKDILLHQKKPLNIRIDWNTEECGPPPRGFKPIAYQAASIFAVASVGIASQIILMGNIAPEIIAGSIINTGEFGAEIVEEARHIQAKIAIREGKIGGLSSRHHRPNIFAFFQNLWH